MKILEICEFSAGICGVWQRVNQESLELSRKGYVVEVFSSNFVKGSEEIASSEDRIDNIKIKRFPAKKLGGESFMLWNFERDALEFKPDVIIAHNYRHLHTTKALKIAKKINAKCFLVTHAPFVEDNSTRSFFGKIAVNLYDRIIGQRTTNRFDKVIAITQWEIPYLYKLGCRKDKIVYIPNGIPKEFFKIKTKKGKGILFLGRISPIKNLEILIKVIKSIKINLDIAGPAEEDYKKKLLDLIEKGNIKNIRFSPAVYDLKRKIQTIDKYEIFVLPSRREAMPQSLVEAMARGKLVISSNTQGGKEIIKDGKNGFLFKIGNDEQLKELIRKITLIPESKKELIRKQAIETSKKFRWKELIKDLEKLF